jgi:hypothetical protein
VLVHFNMPVGQCSGCPSWLSATSEATTARNPARALPNSRNGMKSASVAFQRGANPVPLRQSTPTATVSGTFRDDVNWQTRHVRGPIVRRQQVDSS